MCSYVLETGQKQARIDTAMEIIQGPFPKGVFPKGSATISYMLFGGIGILLEILSKNIIRSPTPFLLMAIFKLLFILELFV